MFANRKETRRTLFRLGASLLLSGATRRLFASPKALPVAFAVRPGTPGASWSYQGYAVHATVMLGSIRLLSKKQVGGASLAMEKAVEGDSEWTGLQFVAGSWPEKLKGFNRFGATQEMVRREKGAVAECGYLSFMSTSRETGFAEAKKAFSSDSPQQAFTFARGRADRKGCAYAVQYRSIGAKCTWLNCVDLLAPVDSTEELPPERPIKGYEARCLPTFLFAVHHALSQTGTEIATAYMHNGKVYTLQSEWKIEESTGLHMMTGRTASEGTHGSEFKVWIAATEGSIFPVKFEYRPKGFLKLTIERDDSAGPPALRPMMRENKS